MQFIGEIGLKSKYLNSEYKKPLCVDLEDVKVSKIHDGSDGLEQVKVIHTADEGKNNHNDFATRREVKKKTPSYLRKLFLEYFPPTLMVTLEVNALKYMRGIKFDNVKYINVAMTGFIE